MLLITPYNKYLSGLYKNNPGLENLSSEKQTEFINNDGFAWCGVWIEPFKREGFDVEIVYFNAMPLQLKWGNENNVDESCQNDRHELLKRRISKFKPDIIFNDNVFEFNDWWIDSIKGEFSFVKYILGYICSPSYDPNSIRKYNIIFTCLRSIEKEMIELNLNVKFLPLAFDSSIINRVEINKKPEKKICFYGGFVRKSKYHGVREEILSTLVKEDIPIDIYSEAVKLDIYKDMLSMNLRKATFVVVNFLKNFLLPNKTVENNLFFNKILQWGDVSISLFDRRLKSKMKYPIYGLNLFNTILKYHSVFNVHGDIAGTEVANMRMYEVTGMGRCLLTDWKPNIEYYFKDGEEVLTYKTVEESIKKIQWIITNPEKALEIGKAGQARTLRDHTYYNRVKVVISAIEECESKNRKYNK
jgi:hypothetical protein